MKRIFFEDGGQDFLYWDIDHTGKVLDAGPFQASVWIGSTVYFHDKLYLGMYVDFRDKRNSGTYTLDYCIDRLEDFSQISHSDIKEGDRVYWWLEDQVCEGGGEWCSYYAKMYKGALCLFQDGLDYDKSEDSPQEVGAFADYKIVRYDEPNQ